MNTPYVLPAVTVAGQHAGKLFTVAHLSGNHFQFLAAQQYFGRRPMGIVIPDQEPELSDGEILANEIVFQQL